MSASEHVKVKLLDDTIVLNWTSGRARTRILDGTESPNRTWTFGTYRVEVCGWRSDDFATAYFKRGTPQADSWLAITNGCEVRRLEIDRGYPRSDYIAIRDAIGSETYNAISANRKSDHIELTPAIESELVAWIRAFDDRRRAAESGGLDDFGLS